MKKTIAFVLSLLLTLTLFVGMPGAPVVREAAIAENETAVDGETAATAETEAAETEAPADAESAATEQVADSSALKTGLAIIANISDSTAATNEASGVANYDITMVAVTVDDNGVIESCIIDGIASKVNFVAIGAITSDITAAPQTKNQLGENYGMKAYGGAKYEWNEQAAALANYACGKTVEELRAGAIGEGGKAADVDLASTATIYLGGYVSAIEKAVANATHLGAQKGDVLKMGVVTSLASSADATAEKAGAVQLDCDVTALTMNGDVITSCAIDSVQAKVGFDVTGALTGDVTAAPQTKNELGEAYGMKAYAGAKYEWNEQAAAFAAYVTGKTVEEVKGIAVNEKTAPADADLSATVTIAIGGFQALIEAAAK